MIADARRAGRPARFSGPVDPEFVSDNIRARLFARIPTNQPISSGAAPPGGCPLLDT
jgi:hypothetical protein